MNTNPRFLFLTGGLTLAMGWLALSGCGIEAASSAQAETAVSDQPVSLAGPIPAPEGWQLHQISHRPGRVTHRNGQTITELDPIVFTPVSNVAAR
jgi:hypothetical protein